MRVKEQTRKKEYTHIVRKDPKVIAKKQTRQKENKEIARKDPEVRAKKKRRRKRNTSKYLNPPPRVRANRHKKGIQT